MNASRSRRGSGAWCGALTAALGCALLLGGCNSGGSGTAANLAGTVMGGTLPLTGATVTLYEVGTGSGSSPTMLGTATTDSSGSFSINYANPGGGAVLYVLADGGNGGGGSNPDIELATAFPATNAPASVTVNELTTVATGYALNGFFSGGGFSNSADGHLALALAPIGDLVNLTTGSSTNTVLQNTDNGTGTTTEAKFNALADALANCVQTTASASACQNLMTDATPGGGAAPVDTLQAVVDIAQNPAHNVAALLTLAPGGPYPAPAASANSLTLALRYTGGGLNGRPYDIAVDSSGDIWIPNYSGNSVTELAPNGTAISPLSGYTGGGLDQPRGIAVNSAGHVWVTNFLNSSVTELAPNGTPLSPPAGFIGGGLNGPVHIAIGPAGHLWISDRVSNAITELAADGSAISPGSGFTGGGLNQPTGIAVDSAGDIWVTNYGTSADSVSEFGPNGLPISPAGGFTGGGLLQPIRLAIAPSGRVWVANSGSAGLTALTLAGAIVTGSPFTSSGLAGGGGGITIDPAGHVWKTNYTGNSITELASNGTPLSPGNGFTGGGLNGPNAILVDGAGNVWITNGLGNSVTEFIGSAPAS